MQRYFIDNAIQSNEFELDETMMHHLNRVLRLQQPTNIIIVDCKFKVFEASVLPLEKRGQIIKEIAQKDDSSIPVTLAVALLKKDKFEWMIQKACELGAKAIIPFTSERTIIDLSLSEFEKKRTRYQLIAKEACEQSHRKTLCYIHQLHSFKELNYFDVSFKGLCYENILNESVSLKSCVNQSTLLVIGPEGGFSPSEVTWAKSHDFKLVSLGHKILRAETAALASLAMIEAYHD